MKHDIENARRWRTAVRAVTSMVLAASLVGVWGVVHRGG